MSISIARGSSVIGLAVISVKSAANTRSVAPGPIPPTAPRAQAGGARSDLFLLLARLVVFSVVVIPVVIVIVVFFVVLILVMVVVIVVFDLLENGYRQRLAEQIAFIAHPHAYDIAVLD